MTKGEVGGEVRFDRRSFDFFLPRQKPPSTDLLTSIDSTLVVELNTEILNKR